MIQKNRKKFSDKAMYLQEKLPLEKFIPAAFIIFLLCIFVLSLFTYKNIERYKEEYDLITHTNEVIKRLNLTYINAVNHQLLNLRYGDSGDSAYLTEYDSLNIITLSLMNELKIMAIYDSDYENKLVYLDSLILLNIQINDIRDYVNDENQVEIIKKKTGILKEINITIQDLKSIGMNLMSDLKSEAEESNSSVQLFIIVTSLFSFLVIALSLYIFENLIKHKKRAEDLLLKSFEELEDNVKERTLELEESNLKLTEEIKVRERNERFLKIQYEVSQILEESETVEEASKKLLTNICKGIEWNFGMLWLANEKNEFTKPESFWSDKEINMDEYMNFNRSSEAGSKYFGYPDKFYHKGKSKWSKDINNDPDFAGKEEALKMGWISGMGIPVYSGKNVIAIIECFNNKSIEEKKDLLEVLESASRQFGNFIERKRAEENLRISNLQLEDRVKEKTNELSETLSKLLTEISAKEKVQNKIKLFAHAIRSIKDCVFITDLEINTIYINKAFEDTYGYNENELLGREIPILNNKIISKTLKEDILKYTFSSGWRGELITHRNDGT
ncbi:MAG: PAS domain S-box protein, partial [Ignavibacteria bacterium]|nr:PAS domain S-box protein [Ignavibacteria bacterium]